MKSTPQTDRTEKPGLFARLWQKLDNKMKAKAEEKSSCCCGCGNSEPKKASSDKCC